MERAITQAWLLEIREYWARIVEEKQQGGMTVGVREANSDPELPTIAPPLSLATLGGWCGGSRVLRTCPDAGGRPTAGDKADAADDGDAG